LDNFHGGDCAVDGCPGGSFWTGCGAPSARPVRHFGRDELCLPPQIVKLKIVKLKIAELMNPWLSPKRPAFAIGKLSHGILSGTFARLSACRQRILARTKAIKNQGDL
jgi:hypothetical protein